MISSAVRRSALDPDAAESGSRLARLVPFETEADLVGDRVIGFVAPRAEKSGNGVVDYLQELTDRVAVEMELPAHMKLRVHFMDVAVPTAFATLGGHRSPASRVRPRR